MIPSSKNNKDETKQKYDKPVKSPGTSNPLIFDLKYTKNIAALSFLFKVAYIL